MITPRHPTSLHITAQHSTAQHSPHTIKPLPGSVFDLSSHKSHQSEHTHTLTRCQSAITPKHHPTPHHSRDHYHLSATITWQRIRSLVSPAHTHTLSYHRLPQTNPNPQHIPPINHHPITTNRYLAAYSISRRPWGVKSTSHHPVNFFSRFHSDSPCRTRINVPGVGGGNILLNALATDDGVLF
jgi:hypothetical protein